MADKKIKRMLKKYDLFFTAVFAVLISVGICVYSEIVDSAEPSVPAIAVYDEDYSDFEVISPETRSAVEEIRIDINNADADELMKLDGIGSAIAEKIIDYRTDNGVFHSVDELGKVNGIGESKLENIRPYIYVDEQIAKNDVTEISDTSITEIVSEILSSAETIAAETEPTVTETTVTTTVSTENDFICIDINTAGIDELVLLDGIGEATAEKIISYRNEHNGFSSKEEIMNVKGIGEKKYKAIEEHIYVSEKITAVGSSVSETESVSESRININTADKETLKTLDGIGDVLAERIISYRNENGDFVSIHDIMNVKGIGESKFNAISEYICT